MLTNLILFTALAITGITACNKSTGSASGKTDSVEEATANEKPRIDTAVRIATYKKVCASISAKQKSFQRRYAAAADEPARTKIEAEARSYLVRMMSDSVFPAWYETTWDFNGVSQEPLTGPIACGYFVTTTLRQSKFDIDRVYLAQQASSVLIRKVCDKDRIKVVTNGQLPKLLTYMEAQPDGIYILGLDNHVGYVVKKGKTLDMVHSSYWPQVKVVREKLVDSAIIKESKYFMIGNVLHSDATLQGWLKGTAI